MITYDQFFAQWNGKPCEVSDPTNPNQCMDLAFAWCDALEIPRVAIAHLYAYQVYTQPIESTYLTFYRIPNTPNAIPKQGDLIVWNYTYNGTAGHIGVCTGRADLKTFDAFEQNDPLKSVCHVKGYDYNNVLGWLRPLALTNSNCQQYMDQIKGLQIKIDAAKTALG